TGDVGGIEHLDVEGFDVFKRINDEALQFLNIHRVAFYRIVKRRFRCISHGAVYSRRPRHPASRWWVVSVPSARAPGWKKWVAVRMAGPVEAGHDLRGGPAILVALAVRTQGAARQPNTPAVKSAAMIAMNRSFAVGPTPVSNNTRDRAQVVAVCPTCRF